MGDDDESAELLHTYLERPTEAASETTPLVGPANASPLYEHGILASRFDTSSRDAPTQLIAISRSMEFGAFPFDGLGPLAGSEVFHPGRSEELDGPMSSNFGQLANIGDMPSWRDGTSGYHSTTASQLDASTRPEGVWQTVLLLEDHHRRQMLYTFDQSVLRPLKPAIEPSEPAHSQNSLPLSTRTKRKRKVSQLLAQLPQESSESKRSSAGSRTRKAKTTGTKDNTKESGTQNQDQDKEEKQKTKGKGKGKGKEKDQHTERMQWYPYPYTTRNPPPLKISNTSTSHLALPIDSTGKPLAEPKYVYYWNLL